MKGTSNTYTGDATIIRPESGQQILRIPQLICLAAFILALSGWRAAGSQQGATAVAYLESDEVSRIVITSGGSGYGAPPSVTLVGGGGSGASAIAQVYAGVVTNIILESPGSGYTNAPTVAIEPPPPPITPATLSIAISPKLVVTGQAWQVQEIQYANPLGDTNQWFTLTNIVSSNSPFVYVDSNAPLGARFYRVVTLGAAGPDPSRWAWINPGTFTMGSPDTEFDRSTDEGPQTQVTITNGFWVERFLLTEGEYIAVVGTNSSTFTNDMNMPAENMSWFEASNYCAQLSAQEQAAGRLPAGYVYRLPTEAEWEYADRAGTTTRFFFGDDLDYSQVPNYGWIQTNSGAMTHDVGQKLPNPWGLYDTCGNVFEFCSTAYAPYPGGSVTNPFGATFSTNMAMRGGSFRWPGYYDRSAARASYGLYSGAPGIGFRVVLAPPLN